MYLNRDQLEIRVYLVMMEMKERKVQKGPGDHRDHEDPKDHPYVNGTFTLLNSWLCNNVGWPRC